jgi:hypothetical protein
MKRNRNTSTTEDTEGTKKHKIQEDFMSKTSGAIWGLDA